MAKFCTQCGTPAANEAVKFCAKCGASFPVAAPAPPPAQAAASPASPPVAAPAAPVQAAGPAAATSAAKASSPLVKILLGLLAFFVLIGTLGVATCFYIGYKAKQRLAQARAEYGESGPAATARDVCSLISKEEVSQLTGATVTDAQGSTSKCTYSSATNPIVLETDVAWQGGKLALKFGVAAMRHMGPVNTFKQLPDIGDEAYTIALPAQTEADMKQEAQKDQSGMVKGMTHLMAMSPLMFRKADVMVTLRLMEAADPDTAKQGIAKLIASRL